MARAIDENSSEIQVCFWSCLIHYHRKAVMYQKRRKSLWQGEDAEGCFFSKLVFHVWIQKTLIFPFSYLSRTALEAEAINLQNSVALWLK